MIWRSAAILSAAVAVLLLLAACAQSFTPEQNMAVMCRGYAGTLSTLAAFKADMTTAQIDAVDGARSVVTPLCAAAASGQLIDLERALTAIRGELRTMLVIEKEMKP